MVDDPFAAPTTPTPVYVIGGYLGSGKTTLLKRLLEHELARGRRPAVLMNEFGDADVDGHLACGVARGEDVAVQAILNGCVCCDLGEEFEVQVRRLSAESAGPVFVETTGLADVAQVAASVRRALQPSTATAAPPGRLAGVVCLLDTPRFAAQRAAGGAATRQLRAVDTVLLNKADQASAETRRAVRRAVRRANPRCRLIDTVFADAPLDRLWPARARPAIAVGPPVDTTRGYASVAVELRGAVDPARLAALLRRHPRSVPRVKGLVRVTGGVGWHELHWVPNRLDLRPFPARGRLRSRLVVIGRRLAWERFFRALNDCIIVRPGRRASEDS